MKVPLSNMLCKTILSLVVLLFLHSFGFASFTFKKPNARTVIGLFENDKGKEFLYENVEFILNHLGLKMIYHDLYSPLSFKQLKDIRAAVIWSKHSHMENPNDFIEKVEQLHQQGIKIIFLGAIPALSSSKSGLYMSESKLNKSFNLLGIHLGKMLTRNPHQQKLQTPTPEMLNFERNLEYKSVFYHEFKNTDSKNEVHASVLEKFQPDRRCDIIVTGSFGGYALDPAVIAINTDDDFFRQWILNPFLFFEKALELKETPRADITTLNGRRILYCHIDGDAFTGVCQFNNKLLCGESINQNILKKYPFPHTLSLVHCWFDPDVSQVSLYSVEDKKIQNGIKLKINNLERKTWIESAQKIFSQPFVEHALHGYGHPLYWKREILALKAEGKPFNIRDEIDKSISIFKNVVKDSDPKIFLWTGDCRPTDQQLEHTSKLGLINMNGGDTMLDASHNSVSHVSSFYRSVGNHIQVHTSAANENIYTNEWSGPFYGYRNVIATFKNTENPRRLTPVNIYYHWYSGQYKASLKALEEVYEWVSQQSYVPVWASHHIANVHSFIQCRYEKTEDGWRIWDHGQLKTIRFDHMTQRTPEVSAETNVIGYFNDEKALYIHLGEKPSSEIKWIPDSRKQTYLSWATCKINRLSTSEEGLELDLWGYSTAELAFVNLNQDLTPELGVSINKVGKKTFLKISLNGHKKVLLKWKALN